MPSVSTAVKTFIRTYAEMNPNEERAALLDLREQVSDLEEENRELRRENSELRERLASKKRLQRIGSAYYVLEDDGTKTGPVCPECYSGDGIVCALEECQHGARCARCSTRYPGVRASVQGPRQRIL